MPPLGKRFAWSIPARRRRRTRSPARSAARWSRRRHAAPRSTTPTGPPRRARSRPRAPPRPRPNPRRRPGPRPPRTPRRARSQSAGRRDASATPHRPPAPPPRARGYTPFKSSRDPELTPRATPPQPLAVTPARPALAIHPRARDRRLRRPRRCPDTTGAHERAQTPAVPRPAARGRAPTPAQRPPSQPGQAFAPSHTQQPGRATRPSHPQNVVMPETPAYGVQRPLPQDFALARTVQAPGPFAPRDPSRASSARPARVQLRAQRPWGGAWWSCCCCWPPPASAFTCRVIPLDVLITWNQPTGLAIKTNPAGATVRLDGAPLASTAPTTVSVYRDRNDHVLEASRPGSGPPGRSSATTRRRRCPRRSSSSADPNAEPAAAPPARPKDRLAAPARSD